MTNVNEYIKSLRDCSIEQLEEYIGKAVSRLDNWGYPRGADYDKLARAVIDAKVKLHKEFCKSFVAFKSEMG